MNNLDKVYHDLLNDILTNGNIKKDRTGTGTISIFGAKLTFDMKDGFPLLTTKKMAWKQIVTELIWFLKGETNIQWLVQNNCNIWTGDAYKKYSKSYSDTPPLTKEEFTNAIKTDDDFAKLWGDLGPIYGKQWRNWNGREELVEEDGYHFGGSFGGSTQRVHGVLKKINVEGIDQIQNLIDTLKRNPDDRRMMVTAWNPYEVDKAVLPPCHYGFQVYTRELSDEERITLAGGKPDLKYPAIKEQQLKTCDERRIPKRAISLSWNQRSVDTFLGLPFNIASYGILLHILGKAVNMIPDQLIGNLGDTHIYLNHVDQVKEQLTKKGFDLPSLYIDDNPFILASKPDETFSVNELVKNLSIDSFQLKNYQSESQIKAPLSN